MVSKATGLAIFTVFDPHARQLVIVKSAFQPRYIFNRAQPLTSDKSE